MAGRYDYDGVENLGGLPVLHEDEDTQGGSRTGEQLRADREVVLAAVQQNGYALEDASELLRALLPPLRRETRRRRPVRILMYRILSELHLVTPPV